VHVSYEVLKKMGERVRRKNEEDVDELCEVDARKE
jgi:hypothetical protein